MVRPSARARSPSFDTNRYANAQLPPFGNSGGGGGNNGGPGTPNSISLDSASMGSSKSLGAGSRRHHRSSSVQHNHGSIGGPLHRTPSSRASNNDDVASNASQPHLSSSIHLHPQPNTKNTMTFSGEEKDNATWKIRPRNDDEVLRLKSLLSVRNLSSELQCRHWLLGFFKNHVLEDSYIIYDYLLSERGISLLSWVPLIFGIGFLTMFTVRHREVMDTHPWVAWTFLVMGLGCICCAVCNLVLCILPWKRYKAFRKAVSSRRPKTKKELEDSKNNTGGDSSSVHSPNTMPGSLESSRRFDDSTLPSPSNAGRMNCQQVPLPSSATAGGGAAPSATTVVEVASFISHPTGDTIAVENDYSKEQGPTGANHSYSNDRTSGNGRSTSPPPTSRHDRSISSHRMHNSATSSPIGGASPKNINHHSLGRSHNDDSQDSRHGSSSADGEEPPLLDPSKLCWRHDVLGGLVSVLIFLNSLLADSIADSCIQSGARSDNPAKCTQFIYPYSLAFVIISAVTFRMRLVSTYFGFFLSVALRGISRVIIQPGDHFLHSFLFELVGAFIFAVVAHFLDTESRSSFAAHIMAMRNANAARRYQQEVDDVLRSVIPEHALSRLGRGLPVLDISASNTVSICDLYDFERWSTNFLPTTAIQAVGTLTVSFDKLVRKLKLQKVKAHGDSYICCTPITSAEEANTLGEDNDSPAAILRNLGLSSGLGTASAIVTLGLHQVVAATNLTKEVLGKDPLKVRVGIHTGVSFAAVVGTSTVKYDVFGDAINTASTIVNRAEPFTVAVSETTLGVNEVFERFEFFIPPNAMKPKGYKISTPSDLTPSFQIGTDDMCPTPSPASTPSGKASGSFRKPLSSGTCIAATISGIDSPLLAPISTPELPPPSASSTSGGISLPAPLAISTDDVYTHTSGGCGGGVSGANGSSSSNSYHTLPRPGLPPTTSPPSSFKVFYVLHPRKTRRRNASLTTNGSFSTSLVSHQASSSLNMLPQTANVMDVAKRQGKSFLRNAMDASGSMSNVMRAITEANAETGENANASIAGGLRTLDQGNAVSSLTASTRFRGSSPAPDFDKKAAQLRRKILKDRIHRKVAPHRGNERTAVSAFQDAPSASVRSVRTKNVLNHPSTSARSDAANSVVLDTSRLAGFEDYSGVWERATRSMKTMMEVARRQRHLMRFGAASSLSGSHQQGGGGGSVSASQTPPPEEMSTLPSSNSNDDAPATFLGLVGEQWDSILLRVDSWFLLTFSDNRAEQAFQHFVEYENAQSGPLIQFAQGVLAGAVAILCAVDLRNNLSDWRAIAAVVLSIIATLLMFLRATLLTRARRLLKESTAFSQNKFEVCTVLLAFGLLYGAAGIAPINVTNVDTIHLFLIVTCMFGFLTQRFESTYTCALLVPTAIVVDIVVLRNVHGYLWAMHVIVVVLFGITAAHFMRLRERQMRGKFYCSAIADAEVLKAREQLELERGLVNILFPPHIVDFVFAAITANREYQERRLGMPSATRSSSAAGMDPVFSGQLPDTVVAYLHLETFTHDIAALQSSPTEALQFIEQTLLLIDLNIRRVNRRAKKHLLHKVSLVGDTLMLAGPLVRQGSSAVPVVSDDDEEADEALAAELATSAGGPSAGGLCQDYDDVPLEMLDAAVRSLKPGGPNANGSGVGDTFSASDGKAFSDAGSTPSTASPVVLSSRHVLGSTAPPSPNMQLPMPYPRSTSPRSLQNHSIGGGGYSHDTLSNSAMHPGMGAGGSVVGHNASSASHFNYHFSSTQQQPPGFVPERDYLNENVALSEIMSHQSGGALGNTNPNPNNEDPAHPGTVKSLHEALQIQTTLSVVELLRRLTITPAPTPPASRTYVEMGVQSSLAGSLPTHPAPPVAGPLNGSGEYSTATSPAPAQSGSLRFSAMVVLGPANVVVIGSERASFDVMGVGPRRCKALLNAASQGFIGCDESIGRLLSHVQFNNAPHTLAGELVSTEMPHNVKQLDGKSLIGPSVQWAVRGVGVTTVYPLLLSSALPMGPPPGGPMGSPSAAFRRRSTMTTTDHSSAASGGGLMGVSYAAGDEPLVSGLPPPPPAPTTRNQ